MDGAQWGNLAEWAAVAAAVGIAIWSSWRAGRAAKNADEARERSARALEIAAAAQDRLVTLAEAEATKYQIPWRIEPAGKSRYLLVNDGDEPAHDVSLECDFVMDSPVTQKRVDPRGAMEFFAPRAFGGQDDTVTVHWWRHPGQGGDHHQWSHPLP